MSDGTEKTQPPYSNATATYGKTRNIYNRHGGVIARAIDDDTAELIAVALNAHCYGPKLESLWTRLMKMEGLRW